MSEHPILHMIATAVAMPETVIDNRYFGNAASSPIAEKMFLGTRHRRHVSRAESSVSLFAQATRKLVAELSADRAFDPVAEIDGIITNVSLPDMPFTGCGAMLAQELGLKPKRVLDMHNGGCVSFVIMMEYAQMLMQTQGLKHVLICTAQTAAGRIFGHPEIRKKPQSAIPGDGAAVALFGREGPVVVENIIQHCHPDFASDMVISFDDQREYWEPGTEPGYLDFPDSKISTIIMRGNRLVPQVMHETCAQAGIRPRDLDGLITNQPNLFFLRNWREAMELPPEKHFHTFEEYANLFQAGIPVSLDHAWRTGKIQPGNRILLAGFSHAGDYSAGAVLRFS